MANKKGNPAPKGNQYAKGRTLLEGQIATRRLTRAKLEEILHKYMHSTKDELALKLKEPGDTPAIELMVISVMAKALQNGDTYRLEFLLNRLIGKVPDKIDFTDRTADSEREALKKMLIEVAKKPE